LGKSIGWVQEVLGHASPDTTLRRNSHFISREREDMGFLRLVSDPEQARSNPEQSSLLRKKARSK